MQAESAASRVPEPTPQNLSTAEGLNRVPLNSEAREKFAENMAKNIIQSILSQMAVVQPRVSSRKHDEEALAEELASAVIDIALREVSRGQSVEGFQTSTSAGVKMGDGQTERQSFLDEGGRQREALNADTEIELQSTKDRQPYHPPLSQSGLPVVGSLDYPDAPPTTPLLPELERSRHSFARKLKGGLAKVFLPSPPPPTPKEKEGDSDGAHNDGRVELMEQLMHSLCTDEMTTDCAEVGSQHGAAMEAFAESLSFDIMEWVFNAKSINQKVDDSSLHLLAHQLAETIITSSLDEAKMVI